VPHSKKISNTPLIISLYKKKTYKVFHKKYQMRGGRGNFRDKGLRLRGKKDWRIGKGYIQMD
jgi:CO dehydrogenase/acetyl-CoA synthase alpha subunit